MQDRQACKSCAVREGRGAFSTKQTILAIWQTIAFKCLKGNQMVPLIVQQRFITSENAKLPTFNTARMLHKRTADITEDNTEESAKPQKR